MNKFLHETRVLDRIVDKRSAELIREGERPWVAYAKAAREICDKRRRK